MHAGEEGERLYYLAGVLTTRSRCRRRTLVRRSTCARRERKKGFGATSGGCRRQGQGGRVVVHLGSPRWLRTPSEPLNPKVYDGRRLHGWRS